MFYTALSNKNKHRLAGQSPATFFYTLFFFTLLSCASSTEENNQEVVAAVYDKKLTKDELLMMIPAGLDESDSLEFVKNYIDEWVKENVLLVEAEKELGAVSQEIERRVEKNKTSLMIYEFEKKYIAQHLDTIVTEEEIQKHYDDNLEDFELKDYIIKAMYLKFSSEVTAKQKADINKWLKSGKKEDLIKLNNFASGQAISFYQDRDNWIFLNDILRDMPMEIANKEYFLRTNKLVEFSDDEFYYVLQILDFKLKSESSPLSFEKENIKSRILQSRMNELIKGMRNNLVKNAYENNQVEISKVK